MAPWNMCMCAFVELELRGTHTAESKYGSQQGVDVAPSYKHSYREEKPATNCAFVIIQQTVTCSVLTQIFSKLLLICMAQIQILSHCQTQFALADDSSQKNTHSNAKQKRGGEG